MSYDEHLISMAGGDGETKTEADRCTDADKACRYLEPHNHGFDCDETCPCIDTRFRLRATLGPTP